MSTKLDKTDCVILRTLQANAKITNVQLAEDIGLSPASTLERVKKLENQGVIKSYHARLDHHKLSLKASLWLQIRLRSLTSENIAGFKEAIAHLPEVVESYQVVGNADFFVKVIATDISTYQDILVHKLSSITTIKRIKSFLISATLKEAGVPVTPLFD